MAETFLSARAKPAPRQRRGRAKRETSGSEAGGEEAGTFDFWLIVAMIMMDTISMFRKRSNYFFSCSSERATFATASERELCPSEVVLLFGKDMNPFKMKYKGASPIWEWPPLAIFIYFLIVTFIAFHKEIYDLFRY